MSLKPQHLALLPLFACGLVACSAGEDATSPAPDAAATETPIPVEPDGGIGDGAGPPEGLPASDDGSEAEEPSAFAKTFPVAIRGKWRETDGAAVTRAQCDGYQQENMGKVLTVREDGYSYFETGGQPPCGVRHDLRRRADPRRAGIFCRSGRENSDRPQFRHG